jgi:hypothetical protein
MRLYINITFKYIFGQIKIYYSLTIYYLMIKIIMKLKYLFKNYLIYYIKIKKKIPKIYIIMIKNLNHYNISLNKIRYRIKKFIN